MKGKVQIVSADGVVVYSRDILAEDEESCAHEVEVQRLSGLLREAQAWICSELCGGEHADFCLRLTQSGKDGQ